MTLTMDLTWWNIIYLIENIVLKLTSIKFIKACLVFGPDITNLFIVVGSIVALFAQVCNLCALHPLTSLDTWPHYSIKSNTIFSCWVNKIEFWFHGLVLIWYELQMHQALIWLAPAKGKFLLWNIKMNICWKLILILGGLYVCISIYT